MLTEGIYVERMNDNFIKSEVASEVKRLLVNVSTLHN